MASSLINNPKKVNDIRSLTLFLLTTVVVSTASARSALDTIFPLDRYDQTISSWIDPDADSYDRTLIESSLQERRKEQLYQHLFGALSPWNEKRVALILKDALRSEEEENFKAYSNSPSSYYGQDSPDSTPYPPTWTEEIKANSNLSQLDHLNYNAHQRGITVENLAARVLPTDQRAFLKPTLPGEGDSFDYLQMSAVWIGTPVYIIATTRDKEWSLALTPDFIAWIKSAGVASVAQDFVDDWTSAARRQLIAITKTATALQDEEGRPLSQAYVGSCFPAWPDSHAAAIMIPTGNHDQLATKKKVFVDSSSSAPIPLALTPHHMADMMSSMIGRSYGWGGIDFYNDCSAELKSLLLPFGFFLPRHSSDQISIGKVTDKSSSSPKERISYLIQEGKPFLSLVYIGGHVFLYIGSFQGSLENSPVAMTYQNLWGLRPTMPPDRRAIIGQSVLFPLLLEYPEDPMLTSLASKQYFQICDLSQFPNDPPYAQRISLQAMLINEGNENVPRFAPEGEQALSVHLRSLIRPEHLYNKM
jgi:hypothetical protein